MNQPHELSWLDEALTAKKEAEIQHGHATPWRVDLYHIPWLRPLLASRWPQFVIRSLTLAGFIFTIAAGLLGSVVGSHNFAIIFVWLAWWTALKLVFIPLGGRSWCSVCPLPLPGEWLQQGGILEKAPHRSIGNRRFGLNLRWPKGLKGSWLQSGSFLLIGLFSAVTLTDARVTGWVLVALFGLAIGLSLVFERRAFCSYLCPIGGFTGLYAQTAPVEVRVMDTRVCAEHREKTCYQDCPWGVYPVAFRNSAACGLCMECLRVCPKDNIALNLRPFGTDIGEPRSPSRLDDAFLALVMLGSVLAFAAVFTGPWGGLKSAAFTIGSSAWVRYALGFLVLNLIIMPGLFYLAVWTSQKWSHNPPPTRRTISNQAQALLPLGLFAWIAFTIAFAFPKASFVLSVLSDPFGWGWNLLGTANTPWSPDVSSLSPILQVILLLVGLFWSANVVRRLGDSNFRRYLPLLAFCLVFSLSMLWLLVG